MKKTKEKRNIVWLTFCSLNKPGVVFACFLLGVLILVGAFSWRTLQEIIHKYQPAPDSIESTFPSAATSESTILKDLPSDYELEKNVVGRGEIYRMIWLNWQFVNKRKIPKGKFFKSKKSSLSSLSNKELKSSFKHMFNSRDRLFKSKDRPFKYTEDSLFSPTMVLVPQDKIREELEVQEYKKEYTKELKKYKYYKDRKLEREFLRK
jgi:hypothetical protein